MKDNAQHLFYVLIKISVGMWPFSAGFVLISVVLYSGSISTRETPSWSGSNWKDKLLKENHHQYKPTNYNVQLLHISVFSFLLWEGFKDFLTIILFVINIKRTVRLMLTRKSLWENILVDFFSFFLAYALDSQIVFLKLLLIRIWVQEETVLRISFWCPHLYDGIGSFQHMFWFKYLCILFHKNKHRSAFFYWLSFPAFFSSCYFHFRHYFCSQIRRCRIGSLPKALYCCSQCTVYYR